MEKFREHRNFGEEFNPFAGQKKLKGSQGSLGRSRKFILGGVIEGFVEIGKDAHIFGDDNASLLSVEEENVVIRPFSVAIGTLSVVLHILEERAPLDIICQVRVGDVVMVGRNEWVWDGIANREQGGLFSRFFIAGNRDTYTQLAVDTELKNPNSNLHRMQFKFGVKYLPEELINKPNSVTF